MVQCHYAEFPTDAIGILRAGDIIVVRSIEIAAACLAAAERFHVVSTRGRPNAEIQAVTAADEASPIIAGAQAQGRNSLLETEALRLLAAYGVALPRSALLTAPDDAQVLAPELLDVPVALKIVSKDILHKSDVGGVRLGVSGATAIRNEAAALLSDIGNRCPGAEIAGVLVTPMAEKGVEVIIGVTSDPQFGRVLMFGLGGVFVEVLNDVVLRALPLDRAEAGCMLDEIRGRALLAGIRGAPPIDRDKLISLLLGVSRLAMAHPEISEIDLNPVIVNANGYTVVDARMLLA
jgi:acetate---CoA ligase (ADP-forming)